MGTNIWLDDKRLPPHGYVSYQTSDAVWDVLYHFYCRFTFGENFDRIKISLGRCRHGRKSCASNSVALLAELERLAGTSKKWDEFLKEKVVFHVHVFALSYYAKKMKKIISENGWNYELYKRVY